MVETELNAKDFKEFFQVISELKTPDECKRFLRDVCTISELRSISERFQVAKRVNNKESYRKIAELTGASTATVTRVAHWLNHGMGGYKLVLDRMEEESS